MLHFVRRSLLIQLLSVYLLFVVVVLLGGFGVNAVVAERLRNDVQAADQALAQEIALQASLQIAGAQHSLSELGALAAKAPTPTAIATLFHAFQAARSDVDHVYWLNPVGDVSVSWPQGVVGT